MNQTSGDSKRRKGYSYEVACFTWQRDENIRKIAAGEQNNIFAGGMEIHAYNSELKENGNLETQTGTIVNFVDKADFEELKKRGEERKKLRQNLDKIINLQEEK